MYSCLLQLCCVLCGCGVLFGSVSPVLGRLCALDACWVVSPDRAPVCRSASCMSRSSGHWCLFPSSLSVLCCLVLSVQCQFQCPVCLCLCACLLQLLSCAPHLAELSPPYVGELELGPLWSRTSSVWLRRVLLLHLLYLLPGLSLAPRPRRDAACERRTHSALRLRGDSLSRGPSPAGCRGRWPYQRVLMWLPGCGCGRSDAAPHGAQLACDSAFESP